MSKRLAKILIIDDEVNIRKFAQANLTASGYKVFVASDGEEGLRLAKLERPDLILLDLRMTGMSGWDVLMVLKTNRKLRRIPVIIMTATAPEAAEYQVRGMRTAGYVIKPFSTDKLLDTVRQVLGECPGE